MRVFPKFLLLNVLCCFFLWASAQRTYRPVSVLATGNWFKLSVTGEGVYRLDVPFLNSLGITGAIPSSQLRIFGSDGGPLPEANSEPATDDLEEVALSVEDGNDGVLNGADYILFYARGPDQWTADSANQIFVHRKNIYSDKAYYYLTVGGSGLRVGVASLSLPASSTVTSFDARYAHELDTVNFLSSGKEWYGEEFSGFPGRSLSRTFNLPLSGLLPGQATIVSKVAGRSVNTPSRFTVAVNNQAVQVLTVPPIGTGVYDLFAQQVRQADRFQLGAGSATVTISYDQGSFNSQGWLDWFEFFARQNLAMPAGGGQLSFRDWQSVGAGVAGFVLSGGNAATVVWDVTDPFRPVKMNTSSSSGQVQFSNDALRLHEYIAFSGQFPVPAGEGRVANQNLHGTGENDLYIICAPSLAQQAQRLAQFHRQKNGLRVTVVTTDQVFNEFSGGQPDPSALRNFMKMNYDRNRASWAQSGKYLLLFGKASFDFKNRVAGNTNLVPAYESANSLDPLSTYTSDDFFGFLDDQEDINSAVTVNQLDIGIGRIPAKDADEAASMVDKILDYHSPEALGPWRNTTDFIADDEDNNLHLQDAETLAATVSSTAPVFNQQKIYLDAFHQENGSAGGRYPEANAAVNSAVYNGTLIWNFSGHGGPRQLAEEVILDQQIVNGWNNRYRLPLFITATCDFAPFDHPGEISLGENLLLRPRTGAIALMTTTRVVFAFSNRILNTNYLRFAFQPDAAGRYKTLGEAMMAAKNYTYQNSSDIINNRKFTLLGDPAMTLAFPAGGIRITSINGRAVSAMRDTLSALEAVAMEGEVTDHAGNLLTGFQGTAYLSLLDKAQTITTLGNDPTSQPVPFQDQESSLFRGKATVQNGKFSFRFRIPKDINYQFGNGKISLYAQDGTSDGNGYSDSVVIGGISPAVSDDHQGPEIRAYLNDNKFVNGSITNPAPVLLIQLSDSSGINTGSSGIGHDIVATLDNDSHQYYVLNNFYESELDSYQKGNVRFQMPDLPAGQHTLHIKAWDIANNSSEYVLDFTVVDQAELRIDHVLNYPNPFTTRTEFWFEHNQPGTDLSVRIEIFTVTGKLIKTVAQTINTPGNRSNDIVWDGKDEFGQKIGRGVYVYLLRVKTANGKTANKWGRLVVFDK